MEHTEATRALLSEQRCGARNPFFGKKHTPETRARLSAILRGRRSNRTYEISAQTVRIPSGIALGYFAGLLDGEGSVRFRAGRPFIAIYNTDADLIGWLTTNVGGHVGAHDKRGRKVCMCWQVGGARDVFVLCMAARPWLLAKRRDCQAAIEHLLTKYGSRLNG